MNTQIQSHTKNTEKTNNNNDGKRKKNCRRKHTNKNAVRVELRKIDGTLFHILCYVIYIMVYREGC